LQKKIRDLEQHIENANKKY